MKDGVISLPGGGHIPVVMVRSARARRLSLRVSRVDGTVRLTVPQACPLDQVQAFLADRAEWVRGHVATIPTPRALQVGDTVPYLGTDHVLCVAPRPTGFVADHQIFVPPGAVGPWIRAFFKDRARRALVAASDRYAARLGVGYGQIRLKDTRSRWGSCSVQGNLNYSWRLIMAPPAVLDYVAAHEVAHRLEMNHSPDFWALVAGVCPDYRHHRDWLRIHGARLQQVVF